MKSNFEKRIEELEKRDCVYDTENIIEIFKEGRELTLKEVFEEIDNLDLNLFFTYLKYKEHI